MAREYKDSGIEWIGQIPKEWKMTRGKFLFSVLNGYAFDSSLFTNDTNVMPLIRIRDINSYETEAYYMGEYPSDYIVHKDEVLVGMDGDFNVAKWKGNDALLNQRVCKLKDFSETYISQYAYYILPMLLKNKNDVTYATTVKHLSSNDILNFDFIVPSLSEQRKIANYLDKVCSEVDEMVALQETMIEELKAYKQSVITEAVTKGLNPNAPMRNSGIDWIGEIPEHWEVQPFKWILRKPLQYGANESGVLYDDSLPRYVRITDILNNSLREDLQKQSLTDEQAEGYILEDDDILFARSGGTVGKAFIYKKEYGRCAFAGYLIRAQIKAHCCPNYVYYYTQSQSYDEWKRQIFIQATIQNIGADRYSLMELPVPPLSEQRTIASYLDTKCSEIDALIAIKQSKIEELKEYKKSVIYEYVTGKKEVV